MDACQTCTGPQWVRPDGSIVCPVCTRRGAWGQIITVGLAWCEGNQAATWGFLDLVARGLIDARKAGYWPGSDSSRGSWWPDLGSLTLRGSLMLRSIGIYPNWTKGGA